MCSVTTAVLMNKWHLIENQPLLREIYREPPLIQKRKISKRHTCQSKTLKVKDPLLHRSVQNADCRLQTEYKVQTRYKMQTADCRLGIKCRLRPKLGINCRLSERNVFNVPQCHAIAFPSLSVLVLNVNIELEGCITS